MKDVRITNIIHKTVNPSTIIISNQSTKIRDVGITEATAINIQKSYYYFCVHSM